MVKMKIKMTRRGMRQLLAAKEREKDRRTGVILTLVGPLMLTKRLRIRRSSDGTEYAVYHDGSYRRLDPKRLRYPAFKRPRFRTLARDMKAEIRGHVLRKAT